MYRKLGPTRFVDGVRRAAAELVVEKMPTLGGDVSRLALLTKKSMFSFQSVILAALDWMGWSLK